MPGSPPQLGFNHGHERTGTQPGKPGALVALHAPEVLGSKVILRGILYPAGVQDDSGHRIHTQGQHTHNIGPVLHKSCYMRWLSEWQRQPMRCQERHINRTAVNMPGDSVFQG